MGGWNRGLSSWNKGLTKENDSRVAKISSSLKGRPKSNESKRKNSIAHQGKPAWNTGLTKETDPRIAKKVANSESRKGSKNPFYGMYHSLETRKNISEASKGRIHSIEARKKISESLKGRPRTTPIWNKGLTKETDPRVLKISFPKNPETRKKLSEAKKGIFPSEATRIKLSESKKGNKNSLGFHHSEDTRKKMSLNHRKYQSIESRKKISEAKKRDIKNIEMLRNMTIKKPTKPQLKLFETIKTRFPDKEVVMEQIVKTPVGHKFIDVAIPDLKLGFEWDEPTYHGIFRGSKEKDAERHRLIEAEGWQLTHYSNILELKK